MGLPVTTETSKPPLAVETVSPTRFQSEDMSHFNPQLPEGPIFRPLKSSPNFTWDYRAMRDWKHTAAAGART